MLDTFPSILPAVELQLQRESRWPCDARVSQREVINFYFLVLVLMIIMTSLFCYRFFCQLSPSLKLTYTKPVGCKKASKKIRTSCRALATYKLQPSFSALVKPDNHVVQKFDTRKIYHLSKKVIFFSPFLVCFSFFAFNLARRQSYAYAIGLYTRPEIKS